MKNTCFTLAMVIPLLLSSVAARAQTGFTRALDTDASSLQGVLPPIKLPQPGWSPVPDLQSSDGTATVPDCNDPIVLATVRDGIIESSNQLSVQSSGVKLVSKAAFSTVWVHPTYANRTECDVQVQLDVPFTAADDWEFEAYATNGDVNVFFYDKDDQSDQGN